MFQDVVKFEYDKTIYQVYKNITKFQDVVKFEYDKTTFNPVQQFFQFQDVVKFEYDKTVHYTFNIYSNVTYY